MALSAAACNADAEPTTTTLSCDAYGDEWASGIEEAASLHVEGLAAIEQWGAGGLSQGELASITDDLYLEYFGQWSQRDQSESTWSTWNGQGTPTSGPRRANRS